VNLWRIGQADAMRVALTLLLIGAALSGPALSGPARAQPVTYPAPDGSQDPPLVIYSTLDHQMAQPLIEAFQATRPDVAIRYEDLLTGDIAARVMQETDSGKPSADLVFSSGMDLQLKLANDGYAQPVQVPEARRWPAWANWQDTAFALTFEPAVLVYHKPAFPNGPPQSRLEILNWILADPEAVRGRIGTYDIEQSALGYLFLSRDAEHFPDIWTVLRQMGLADLQTYSTSQGIIDRVADGRLWLGYNILGSYAAAKTRIEPDLGLVLLRDFTVVVSRVALVPRAAANPDLGRDFLSFLMSTAGQTLLTEKLALPSVSLDVSGANSGAAIEAALGDQLRKVPVSPGVLVYLDQAKRKRLLRQWHDALGAAE
jgi:iron(III) transport system substrate-binding protein